MFQDLQDTQASSQTALTPLSSVENGTNIDAAPIASKSHPLHIRRWGDTAKPAEPEWVIDQLILKGAVNTVAGEPGVGKTRIASHIAARVAAGKPFLEYEVHQGPVLYLNFDDSEMLPRMWTARAVRGLEYKQLRDVPLFYWDTDKKNPNRVNKTSGLLDKDVFNDVLSWISGINDAERSLPTLVVVDTFETAFPGVDSNNGNAVLTAYERLNQLQEATGNAAILLVDHTPKKVTNESSERGVSGSQQKKARARTQHIISVSQNAVGTANTDVILWKVDKNNAGPKLPPFAIRREFRESEDADHIFADNVPRSTGAPKEDKAYEYLVSIVRESGSAVMPRRDLEEQAGQDLGVGERTISVALTKLKDDSRVKVHKLGGPGNPIGFSWASEPSQGEQDAFHTSDVASNNSRVGHVKLFLDADFYAPSQGYEYRKAVSDKQNEDGGTGLQF